MKDVSELTALVYDHGLFLPLAQRLARDYGRVIYYTDWQEGFPTVNKALIGDGFDDVERTDCFWKHRDEVDLWIFPDIQNAGLQLELERQGKLVWGSRSGDSIELIREKFLTLLANLGLDVPKFESVRGVSNLREHLRDKKDKFIKISKFRGTMETKRWRSYAEDGNWLDFMAVKLGPVREQLRFLVFDKIDSDIEIGGDTYYSGGRFPGIMIQGYESKDQGYLGVVQKRTEMPEPIQLILDAFEPVLKEYNYANFWSMEAFVADEDVFFIDPCCRAPCPALASQIELYSNMGEIIWAGANRESVDPVPTAKYSAECLIRSAGDCKLWTELKIPDSIRQWTKFGGACLIDGVICLPPDETHSDGVGWLVATGDTVEETIENLQSYADELPEGTTVDIESLADLITEITEAESQGMEFSKEGMPDPAIVIK